MKMYLLRGILHIVAMTKKLNYTVFFFGNRFSYCCLFHERKNCVLEHNFRARVHFGG